MTNMVQNAKDQAAALAMAAYRALGCAEAAEVNQLLAEKEPCDVPLEYVL